MNFDPTASETNQFMSLEDPPTFVVLTIDGLNSFMLGLYGNTMLETPAFDKVASAGIAFDFALSHSCELTDSMRQLFSTSNGSNISECAAGRSVFVSDCAATAQSAQEAQFETIIDIANELDSTNHIANEIGQTRAASFFSAALEAVEQIQPGDLLWLHLSGLSQSWDAPLNLRKQFVGPDDPDAYDSHEPPSQTFDSEVDDPDLLVSIQAALTAQISVIDQLLGVFLRFVSEHPVASKAHLAITSPRGYSLGGGGQIGIGTSLTSESVHVPLLLSVADNNQGGDNEEFSNVRSHSLVQNTLIGKLIEQLTAGDPESDLPFINRNSAVFMDDQTKPIFLEGKDERALQNRFWKLICRQAENGEEEWRLYVKPDDRWDANDVSSRCPQIIEELKNRF